MFFQKKTMDERFAVALSKNDFYFLKLARQRARKKMNLSKQDLRIIDWYELNFKDEVANIKINLGSEHVNHYFGNDNPHKIRLF